MHTRQQRWQVSLQRELTSKLSVEVDYTGTRSDDVSLTIRQDYLPAQYWNSDNTRNTAANSFLTAQVTNPFNIGNFASLQTSDPVLYARLAANSQFTAKTIQRSRLLRAFPQMGGTGTGTGLSYSNLPLGEVKAHSIEVLREPPALQRAQRERELLGQPRDRPTGRSRNSTASPRSGRRATARGRIASPPSASTNCRSAAAGSSSTTAGSWPKSPATGSSAARGSSSPGRCSTGATCSSMAT